MDAINNASTGLPTLDKILNNLIMGDNVVWQVDTIADYKTFVDPFVSKALSEGRNLNYIRFSEFPPLLFEQPGIKIHYLNAHEGFESFSKQIYTIINSEGENAYYVFDSLSELQSAWATDLMIGNFFVITCPNLYELNAVAYFSLLRNSHSFKTIARIRDTTQLLIDVYTCNGNCYIHPLKVQNRYSPTMFFPHKKNGDYFTAITRSDDVTTFISHIQQTSLEKTQRNLDFWDRLFLKAEMLIELNEDPTKKQQMIEQLCKVIIGREERLLTLAANIFTLEDLIAIKNRMIGTGHIGGKAAGMLIARRILHSDNRMQWNDIIEPHDSFYIGSDVFYTYIVQNGWWKLFMEQKTQEGYFTVAKDIAQQMLHGTFTDDIKEQFQQMIEYFGQSPIIVRSSSLLEDSFGNAFAGKYESIFLVNQGSPAQRYQAFIDAVRQIYSSTMNEDALVYRLQRGLHTMNEQMAPLVQRVSGTHRGHYFFPDISGVGFSHNTYVWKKEMKPESGMIRLVIGLGTRAVNRVEGDYPRIVALDDPRSKPLYDFKDVRRFSQHNVDVLNITNNQVETIQIDELFSIQDLNLPMHLLGIRDYEAEQTIKNMNGEQKEYWVVTFDELLMHTDFTSNIKTILQTIHNRYQYPVDIEFTVNFNKEGGYYINILQCRPNQIKGLGKKVKLPVDIPSDHIFFTSKGNFLGGSIVQPIKRIIYVDPYLYNSLSISQKYDVARTVGKLNKAIHDREEMPALLIGPGRWGTTTPSLGVPVRFAEINNIKVLVELALINENIMPELSFGTHFFQDLVETDIFYVALFYGISDVLYHQNFLEQFPDIFTKLLPDSQYNHVIQVFDLKEQDVELMADIITQKVICFMS